MNIHDVVEGIIKDEVDGDGIKCLKLFQIDNLSELQREVEDIVKTKPATVIGDVSGREGHYLDIDEIIENHNKIPEMVTGAWRIYRIFRPDPRWKEDIPYLDNRFNYKECKFHFADQYPNIANFIEKFPAKFVVNISGLIPRTQLLPHNDLMGRYWKEKPSMVIRFHLPLIIDENAYFWFHGKSYFLEPGWVYLFNGATVHSAINKSNKSRYNIIIDCLASTLLDPLFENASEPPFLRHEDLEINPKNIKEVPLNSGDYDISKLYIWDDPFDE